MSKKCFILKYERTEYAKRIRKDYEAGKIKERRCNMRQWGVRRDGLCNTLSTVQKDNYLLEVDELKTDLRIRKLIPKECWRLMGFDDSDFEKAEKVNSNTQLYKQAGNSIVVDVLEALFVNLTPYFK